MQLILTIILGAAIPVIPWLIGRKLDKEIESLTWFQICVLLTTVACLILKNLYAISGSIIELF